MKKRNIIIISIVFISLIFIFTAKIFIQNRNEPISFTGLKTQYNYIKTCSKPSIIIFSFDADCCENTKKFFDEYNIMARQLISDYDDKFISLFINTGTLNDTEMKILRDIEKENGISQIPSILIKDSNSKTIDLIEGPCDYSEVKKILDEVIRQ
jgi:hypothetical protein